MKEQISKTLNLDTNVEDTNIENTKEDTIEISNISKTLDSSENKTEKENKTLDSSENKIEEKSVVDVEPSEEDFEII